MPKFDIANAGPGTLATYSGADLVEIRPGQTMTVEVPEMSPVMRGWVAEGRASIKQHAEPPPIKAAPEGKSDGAESQGGDKASGDKPGSTGKAGGK